LSALVSKRSRLLGVALAGTIFVGACASPNDPGVSVESAEADIVFGVKEPLEDANPANLGGGALGEDDFGNDFIGEELSFGPTKKTGPRPPLYSTGGGKTDCPAAAVNAFPDREATTNVNPPPTPPREGLYRWKREGQQTGPDPLDDTKEVTSTVQGFEDRLVQNLEVLSESETRMQYTFETVQPNLGSATVTLTRWFVDSNPAGDQDVHSPVSGDRVTAGEPERGIVIRGFDILDRRGENVGSINFAPRAGLLVVPLPIRTGERFASAAVDSRSGQTYRIEGTVVKRTQIDACGTVIAGWQIEARYSFPGGEATYNYVAAPQFGGILLQEFVDQEVVNDQGHRIKTKVTFTIGQQDPDPLPKEEE
jgi:hypothetical protein